jgi:hypothetical protein
LEETDDPYHSRIEGDAGRQRAGGTGPGDSERIGEVGKVVEISGAKAE